jgi:signal transduction histidine kinase
MDEAPELAVLVHELGGMLSTVQGFAHIAAENPGHPDRERFIGLTATEARRAAQTVKDIHLVRSLDRGSVLDAPPPVELSQVVDGAPPLMVTVDPPKVAGLLERCIGACVAPPEVTGAQLRIPVASAADLARRAEALNAPYPDMVLYSILRRLLRLWGGDVTIEAAGEWTIAVVAFPEA